LKLEAFWRERLPASREHTSWYQILLVLCASLRASLVERFSRCGKANCHCHHGGNKHGPFYYLTQCLAVGKVNKFLLKAPAQQQAARSAVEHYRQLQEHLEELSQINAQLLRREENLGDD